jgi:hypothetical protein
MILQTAGLFFVRLSTHPVNRPGRRGYALNVVIAQRLCEYSASRW